MRIVALFPGALGDLCLLASSLASVIARGVDVALSVQRSLASVATMVMPGIHVGPPMDGAVMASLFGATLDPALVRWLAGADQVHAWLARADDASAVRARLSTFAASVALHAVPRHDDASHVSLDYAAALGLSGAPSGLHAHPPSIAVALPWSQPEASRLVLHPGAGAPAKVWAIDGFRRVADHWRRAGGEVAVLLGPAEEQGHRSWTAAGYEPLTRRSILEAAALMASAPRFVGNDSGISHLAGALGRRGVVLFGPTRPGRWRPLGGELEVVEFTSRPVDAVSRAVLEHLGAPVP